MVFENHKKVAFNNSTMRAKRATFTFRVDKSSLKMPKIVNFLKSEAGGQTVLPDRSTLIMTSFSMNERKCPDNTVCVPCVRPLFPTLQAFFCYHPTCRKQRRYTRYSIVIIIKNLTPLWPQALEQR